ncbi:MAG: heptosyltransferase [Nitrospirales bacterium]|nr:MAG: heptosyltransferase [Nitrospirales bacterium]
MSKHVLIVNVTRMGDLIQMTPLLKRLEYEWPGVAIDVVVDQEFAVIAKLLPGIRHVLAYDFQALMNETRVRARDVVSMYDDMSKWAKPLVQSGYDRVINLTFNRRSAYLTGYVGGSDIRGLTTAPDGNVIVKDPWMAYFLDMHTYRRINRLNLVDVYALGGSGPGPYESVELKRQASDCEWAGAFLAASGAPAYWIGVQIGASDVMKAWRPEYFGQTMALISQQLNVGFVLIGSNKELPVAQEAVQVYKNAGGLAPLCYAIGKTTIPQLVGLLSQCDLMLTNDTGPMHVAVGVGVPVVNVSVGHVDFRETGPYGPKHWVIQPEIECGPCGFDQVCAHQSCKERLLPRYVSEVCVHALGRGALPAFSLGMRIYESAIDFDQLGTYHLRVGTEPRVYQWYGEFWRKFWFDTCAGTSSQIRISTDRPPDFEYVQEIFLRLEPMLTALCEHADEFVKLTSSKPLAVDRLKACQERLNCLAHEARKLGRTSLAFTPITTACFRDTHNLQQPDLSGMAREHARAYARWRHRTWNVAEQLGLDHIKALARRMVHASTT